MRRFGLSGKSLVPLISVELTPLELSAFVLAQNVADYGKLDGAIEINYQIPSLYVKYIWNKIFNENGFTYSYEGRGGRQDFNPFLKDEWDELAITIDEGFPSRGQTELKQLKPKSSNPLFF